MNKMLDQIKDKIYSKIVNQDGTTEERNLHTDYLINCSAGDEKSKEYVKNLIKEYLQEEEIEDVEEIANKIYSEKWGLGHLEKYDTKDIDEIMIHGTKILIQKKGEVIEVPEKFNNYDETIAIMRRCLEFDKSQDLNAKNAIVTAKRKDGARITAVIPPVGKMPYLNIRKFESFLPSTENMLKSKTLSKEEIKSLEILAKGRANMVVIGEMGSGKTTFMKWLLQFVPENLVIGTMETTFELNLDELYPNRHWIQLEERLPDYLLSDLFAIQLRQNVDIMLVGESRSYEVNELIKAMSRGHSGSIGTAHSLGALEVIDDFADMILESGKKVDLEALKYRIARAIDIVIKFRKLPNKSRVCAGIYEIIADEYEMRYKQVKLFEFVIDEEDPKDKGQHVKFNSISDKLKKKLNEYGVKKSELENVFS